MTEPFNGAKLAVLVGHQIVTILRDDIPSIPWPGHWDFPGGGREGGESPEDCVLRELKEELGLVLTPNALIWSYAMRSESGLVWFFVTECPTFDATDVVFGNEGQCWKLMPIPSFLAHERAIPSLKARLARYLDVRHKFHIE